MARVVPSQVVEMIDQMFPQAKDENQKAFTQVHGFCPDFGSFLGFMKMNIV